MKVYLNPSSILICECGSALYSTMAKELIYTVCLSPTCEDFNVHKIVRQVEIPYSISPTKVTLDVAAGLDLGEQELKRQQEEEKKFQKEQRQVKDLRMFSG